jgi:hypothetical protein
VYKRQLAATGIVPLHVAGAAVPSLERLPRNQGELAALEEGSQVCDLYLWLGTRLPAEFPELEVAKTMRQAAGVAIMEGLRLLARPPASRSVAKAKAQKGQSAFESATLAVQHAMAQLELQGPRSGVGAWDAALGEQPPHSSDSPSDGPDIITAGRRRRNTRNALVL